MVTVSGRHGSILAATLSLWSLISGCTALPSVPLSEVDDASVPAAKSDRTQMVTDFGNAPLPRQLYRGTGEKVPYVAQPNPYVARAVATSVPGEAKAMFIAARNRLERGDLDAAHAQFQALTEKYPSLSGPWVKLGVIAEKQESYDEAISHYRKAISVNRTNVNAYVALGLAQRKQGHFADAQATYLAALDVWKDFPEAHLNLAILYDLYVNEPEQAQKHYEAYDFLTGRSKKNVHKWLVEVRQRTGIDESFIDNPPASDSAMEAAVASGIGARD